MLSGASEDTKLVITRCIGQQIGKVEMNDDSLLITFDYGGIMAISDDGQSCCENRYMTCDDDLSGFEGSRLVDVSVREAEDVKDDDNCDVHEVAFLVVRTTKGDITACTHNEHNGYYGGFAIVAKMVQP